MSAWVAFDDGRSIGKVNREGAVILQDERHSLGGRITLRRGSAHISVSCKINGWMDHTRFFKTVPDAEREYHVMKKALIKVIEMSAAAKRGDVAAWEVISVFVAKFP